MTLDSNFEMKRLGNEDAQTVTDFIIVHYTGDHEGKLSGNIPDLKQCHTARAQLILEQGCSIGVYEKSSQILVAVMLCVVENKQEHNKNSIVNQKIQLSPEMQAIQTFFKKLEDNFYDIFNAEKVFCPGMITVHRQYRHRGIASFLLETSVKFAAEAGCEFVITIPVNDYICSSLSKRGWKVLREINFKNYDRENGTCVFPKAEFPYTKAQLVYIESRQER